MVNHEAEAFENHEAEAEARFPKIYEAKALTPKSRLREAHVLGPCLIAGILKLAFEKYRWKCVECIGHMVQFRKNRMKYTVNGLRLQANVASAVTYTTICYKYISNGSWKDERLKQRNQETSEIKKDVPSALD